MTSSEEVESIHREHRHLQRRLDDLGKRIRALEAEAPAPAVASAPPARCAPSIASPLSADGPNPPLPPLAPIRTASTASPSPAPPSSPPPRIPRPDPESLELRFGQVWLVRIGIVILLTGLVFLGNHAYHEFVGRLGAGGKLSLLYLAAALLAGIGTWFSRRSERLHHYGRVVLAGGLAAAYYATFAAHFVPSLRVIESPIFGGALLLGLGAGFALLADRLRSEILAVATIALSYYVGAINAVGPFSLFSNLVISAVAMLLLARRCWTSVSFLSLVGCYGSFCYWRFHGAVTAAFASDAFIALMAFPLAYWAVHTVAIFLRRTDGLAPGAGSIFLSLNNAACFALAGSAVAAHHPAAAWLFALVFGLTLLGLSALASRRSPASRPVDAPYLWQGLTLVLLAALLKLTGWQLALSLALGGGSLLAMGRFRHGAIFRGFAGLAAILATIVSVLDVANESPRARLVAFAVAAILTVSTALLRRWFVSSTRSDWRCLGLAGLAGLLCVVAGTQRPLFDSSLHLLAIAIPAAIVLPRLGLRESGYVSLGLALFAQFLQLPGADVRPGSLHLLAIAAALPLVFQWKLPTARPLRGPTLWSGLHLLVPVTLTVIWILHRCPLDGRPLAFALAAASALALGFFTRTPALLAASLPLTASAFIAVFLAVENGVPPTLPLLTLVLLAAQSFLARPLTHRSLVKGNLTAAVAIGIRTLSLLALGQMLFAYIPDEKWFLACTALAFVPFLLHLRRPTAEAFAYALALGTLAGFVGVTRLLQAPPFWPDAFGLLAFAAAQRLRRKVMPDVMQKLLCGFAVFGLWILLHRIAAETAGGFLLTVTWSLLALVVLSAGFALREGTYRLLGLLVLVASIGRVYLVDVWQLDTLSRILSFLVLGAVLLALSFLYNRFANAVRRWM